MLVQLRQHRTLVKHTASPDSQRGQSRCSSGIAYQNVMTALLEVSQGCHSRALIHVAVDGRSPVGTNQALPQVMQWALPPRSTEQWRLLAVQPCSAHAFVAVELEKKRPT